MDDVRAHAMHWVGAGAVPLASGYNPTAFDAATPAIQRALDEVPQFLRAQVTRAKSLIASARGDDEAVEENLNVGPVDVSQPWLPAYWTARAQLARVEGLAK